MKLNTSTYLFYSLHRCKYVSKGNLVLFFLIPNNYADKTFTSKTNQN